RTPGAEFPALRVSDSGYARLTNAAAASAQPYGINYRHSWRVEMPDQSQYVPVSVRLPAEVVSALQRTAANEDRTLAAEIRRVLRQHVAGLGGGHAKQPVTPTAA